MCVYVTCLCVHGVCVCVCDMCVCVTCACVCVVSSLYLIFYTALYLTLYLTLYHTLYLRYQSTLDDLVKLASLQTSLKTLDEALKVTNRRVNALEFVILPKIKNTISYIVR